MNKLNTKKGFTIIEVVLVLAIAGLIFLMVFIALPALQRNQRDTQRKNDLSRVQSAVNSYQANNKGKVPDATNATVLTNFTNDYLKSNGDSFQDPTGSAYALGAVLGNGTDGKIEYKTSSTCDGEETKSVSGANKVSVRIKLEGGGNYCLNN